MCFALGHSGISWIAEPYFGDAHAEAFQIIGRPYGQPQQTDAAANLSGHTTYHLACNVL